MIASIASPNVSPPTERVPERQVKTVVTLTEAAAAMVREFQKETGKLMQIQKEKRDVV